VTVTNTNPIATGAKTAMATSRTATVTVVENKTVWNIGTPNAADVTATLDANGKMTISGKGAMQDFGNAPWFSVINKITSLVIQTGVTNIGSCAFFAGQFITGNLTIPNSVTSIGDGAFYGCGFTGNLTIPNSVTSIGDYAFSYCYGLTGSLKIPDLVTSIGDYAFSNCTGLAGITIPSSVTSIGMNAFYNCSGLTGDLKIPNSVTSIGSDAFYKCIGFTGNLTIPNSVTSIGIEAFMGCSGFTTLNYNATNCNSVGSNAFSGCVKLTALNIGNNVQTIPDNAFASCTNLTSVTNNRAAPQTINDNVFAAATYANATLYVLPTSYSAYLTTNGWNKFNHIEQIAAAPVVNAATPTIDAQPQSITVKAGEAATLSVTASVSDGGKLTYQWYSNTTNSTSGGTAIGGATGSSYSPSTITAGTYYFYVVVTNTNSVVTGTQTAPITSAAATVKVNSSTGIENVSQASGLKAWVENGTLHVSGLTAGKPCRVYNVAGVLVASPGPSKGGEEVTTPLPAHGVYIVQSGNWAVKVIAEP